MLRSGWRVLPDSSLTHDDCFFRYLHTVGAVGVDEDVNCQWSSSIDGCAWHRSTDVYTAQAVKSVCNLVQKSASKIVETDPGLQLQTLSTISVTGSEVFTSRSFKCHFSLLLCFSGAISILWIITSEVEIPFIPTYRSIQEIADSL